MISLLFSLLTMECEGGHVIYTVVVYPKNALPPYYICRQRQSLLQRVSKNEDMSMLLNLSYFHNTQVMVSKDDVPGNAMEVEQEMAWTMILSNI